MSNQKSLKTLEGYPGRQIEVSIAEESLPGGGRSKGGLMVNG